MIIRIVLSVIMKYCDAREIAQLKLAEQIAADKEHHLRHFEYQAMTALMEKEALQDELAAVKSIQNTSTMSSSMHETSLQDTPGGTPSRVSSNVCLTSLCS